MPRITKPYTAKSRPILFKGEMIRAILDGRKTQTRRVIKSTLRTSWLLDGRFSDDYVKNPDNYLIKECPYGKIGDFLWVKESFRAVNEYGGDEWTTYAYPRYKDGQSGPIAALEEDYFYKKNKWQSPLFMPRWASRISLRLVEIRVERIQSITGLDIAKEGIAPEWTGKAKDFDQEKYGYLALSAVSDDEVLHHYSDLWNKFMSLWDSINAKKGYGWQENPWVWVIKFERIENENQSADTTTKQI